MSLKYEPAALAFGAGVGPAPTLGGRVNRGTSPVTASPEDPTVGLCLWPYGVPRGVGVFL